MSKYLLGLSYGQMGGPAPQSWNRPPTNAWIKENEPGVGTYTYEIRKGKEYVSTEVFHASSLRDSQRIADQRRDQKGGTYSCYIKSN